MGENIFERFNSLFGEEGLAGLRADVANAASNDGDFVDVPHGDYEVKVTKIELGATGEKSKTPGRPMAKIWLIQSVFVMLVVMKKSFTKYSRNNCKFLQAKIVYIFTFMASPTLLLPIVQQKLMPVKSFIIRQSQPSTRLYLIQFRMVKFRSN